jgi:hypothetical protein
MWIIIGSTADAELNPQIPASHEAYHTGLRSNAAKAKLPLYKMESTVVDITGMLRVQRQSQPNLDFEVVSYLQGEVSTEGQGREAIQRILRYQGPDERLAEDPRTIEDVVSDYVDFVSFKEGYGESPSTSCVAHAPGNVGGLMSFRFGGDTVASYDNCAGTRTNRDYVIAQYYYRFLDDVSPGFYTPSAQRDADPYNEWLHSYVCSDQLQLRSRGTVVITSDPMLRLFKMNKDIGFPAPIRPISVDEGGISATAITLEAASTRDQIADTKHDDEKLKVPQQYTSTTVVKDKTPGMDNTAGKPEAEKSGSTSPDANAVS